MPRQFIAFDIETAKDVPGEDFNWKPHRPLGISCAAGLCSGAAEPIGALARWALLVFVLFMAAEQLAIQTEVLVSAFQIAFAAVCLAAALAFGLGGREWAAQVIARYTRR